MCRQAVPFLMSKLLRPRQPRGPFFCKRLVCRSASVARSDFLSLIAHFDRAQCTVNQEFYPDVTSSAAGEFNERTRLAGSDDVYSGNIRIRTSVVAPVYLRGSHGGRHDGVGPSSDRPGDCGDRSRRHCASWQMGSPFEFAIGVWLMVLPWVVEPFTDPTAATWAAVVVGGIVAALSGVSVFSCGRRSSQEEDDGPSHIAHDRSSALRGRIPNRRR